MSNIVKIFLAIALVIFLAGVTWAIVLGYRTHKIKQADNNNPQPPAVVTTAPPASTPAATAPAASSPAPVATSAQPSGTVSNKPAGTARQTVRYIVIEETSSDTGAWASAGTNDDGSTYAYATAN